LLDLIGQLFFIMKRIALHTLGCKLNLAETAAIGRHFTDRGYDVVGLDDAADVVVINTCSVTERADRECRQLVRRALRHSPDAFVAVVGCYAQLQPREIASIPGVDLILGNKDKFNVGAYVGEGKKRSQPEIAVSCIEDFHETFVASSVGYDGRTRAFLKIQDGCDYSCSFCTIPLARGKSRSIPAETILTEAQRAAAGGYREVVLTGVNVGDYRGEKGTHLIELLRLLTAVSGLERIRISSIEPNLLSDELLDFWVSEPKLCKHWHIPLQSGSDAVLRLMRRRALSETYRDRVTTIRRAVPSAGIGADVIVGFPGETDDLFEETYDFLRDLPVTYLHVFTYSERPNTPAASFDLRVEPRVRAARSERLRSLGLRKRRLFYESFVGRTVAVLLETKHAGADCSGLTEEYVRVRVRAGGGRTNSIVPVTITGASDDYCVGTLS